MANLKKLEIKYGADEKIDKILIRRPRFSTMMRLIGIIRSKAVALDGTVASQEAKMGEFFPQLISETVCDENGKTKYTPDQVDQWTEDENGMLRIMAYGMAINTALNPPEVETAGNSNPT